MGTMSPTLLGCLLLATIWLHGFTPVWIPTLLLLEVVCSSGFPSSHGRADCGLAYGFGAVPTCKQAISVSPVQEPSVQGNTSSFLCRALEGSAPE